MSKLMKIYGAILFGLVLCAGADASAMTKSNYTKRHSAGTAHVSARVKGHVVSHSGSAGVASTATRRGHAVATSSVVRRHGRGARPTLAVRRTRYQEHFSASSFADNLTLGDVTEGEDPVVRAAAIEALGNMNGTAIAINPANGRILAMVNQKLALSRGAEPCSTIKLTVALAALEEGIVRRDTTVNLGGSYHLTLTEALAH